MKSPVACLATTVVVCLFFLTYNVNAQDETNQPVTIGAGLTKSHFNGSGLSLGNEVGYYLQVGSYGKLNDYMAYGADLQFLQQRNKTEGENGDWLNVQSINLSFYYKLYPLQQGVNVLAGFQVGFITRAKFDSENVRGLDESHVGFVGGIGYDINDKINVTVRGTRYITDTRVFDHMIQVGVNYTIK